MTTAIKLIFLLALFTFYVTGTSPALDGGDAGEFIAASHTLGISHAPGYPLIALFLKVFEVAVPWGSIAYRCHVFSALSACALLVALYFLANTQKTAAVFMLAFVATVPLVVEQARVSEVFLLNAAFAVSILLCFKHQRVLLAIFLFGLGLGNHQTLLVMTPALLWGVRFDLRREQWSLAVLALALGLSVYVYLPLRALAGPPVNFGDPETAARFWAVITRKEFGTLSLHPAAVPFRSGVLLLQQLNAFLHRTLTQVGIGGVILCIAGATLGVWRRQTRAVTLLLLIIYIGVGFGFEALSNLSPSSDIGQWRLERFMLLPLLALAGLVWHAFHEAVNVARPALRWTAMGLLAVCLIPSTWAAMTVPSFRWNLAFRDFATSTLRSAPLDTRLIIDRILFDEPTSSLLVATQVENQRPDIRFYYRPGTLFTPIYGKDILDLTWDQRFRRQAQVEHNLTALPGPVRCLAFEKKNAPFEKPVLDGMLYRPDNFLKASPASNFMLVLRAGPTPNPSPYGEGNKNLGDYPTRLILVHTPYFLGKAEAEAGHLEVAQRWFDRATSLGPDMAWLHSNLGGIYAQFGMLNEAERYFEKAAALDPYFYEGPFGVGYVALKEQRFSDAIAAFGQATRVAPERADGWYMLGVAGYEGHDMASARRAWQKYLELDPHGPMAEVVGKKLQELSS